MTVCKMLVMLNSGMIFLKDFGSFIVTEKDGLRCARALSRVDLRTCSSPCAV